MFSSNIIEGICTDTYIGYLRCFLLLRVYTTRERPRWMSEDYKFGIFKNRSVLSKEEFSESITRGCGGMVVLTACSPLQLQLSQLRFSGHTSQRRIRQSTQKQERRSIGKVGLLIEDGRMTDNFQLHSVGVCMGKWRHKKNNRTDQDPTGKSQQQFGTLDPIKV